MCGMGFGVAHIIATPHVQAHRIHLGNLPDKLGIPVCQWRLESKIGTYLGGMRLKILLGLPVTEQITILRCIAYFRPVMKVRLHHKTRAAQKS